MADIGSMLLIAGINTETLIAKILISAVIILIGIVVGKLVKYVLRKGSESLKVDRIVKPALINLFLVVMKWSIYILFVDWALIQLGIPEMLGWLTTILGVIPALTGALIIISVGFGIAVYLREIVLGLKFENGKLLSSIFFYFIIYVFMIFAFKTALISLNNGLLSDVLIATFTILGGLWVIGYSLRNKKAVLK